MVVSGMGTNIVKILLLQRQELTGGLKKLEGQNNLT
jgi:hypothetical protein